MQISNSAIFPSGPDDKINEMQGIEKRTGFMSIRPDQIRPLKHIWVFKVGNFEDPRECKNVVQSDGQKIRVLETQYWVLARLHDGVRELKLDCPVCRV